MSRHRHKYATIACWPQHSLETCICGKVRFGTPVNSESMQYGRWQNPPHAGLHGTNRLIVDGVDVPDEFTIVVTSG